MGSAHSSVHATHFHRQEPSAEPEPDPHDEDKYHISISNKMVERLVEDATLAAAVASAACRPPPPDDKDKILMDKLKHLDDAHSERTGLTIEEVKATALRIDMRMSNKLTAEPVCQEYEQRVIDCYNSTQRPQELAKCWDTVTTFSKCVRDTAGARLRAHTMKEERDAARRSKHITQAREHALKDLGPRPWTVRHD